ncbi:hypothetical protein IV203_022491 [Nitzschia inconspicua]|uniref:Uncharacterized protein n=1 Tax=Nitzschia inconspicua TaxID=303405 RepID=A0A9K3KIS2_9STRA|nr:hypothetical protein IV203_022727 [Nitzschia inconspicua]KAG7344483.1 hypothetical protein IV203_022491 [Nitzschia inconspicua]
MSTSQLELLLEEDPLEKDWARKTLSFDHKGGSKAVSSCRGPSLPPSPPSRSLGHNNPQNLQEDVGRSSGNAVGSKTKKRVIMFMSWEWEISERAKMLAK